MHLEWYLTDSGAGECHLRGGGGLALPSTPCLPPLPQLRPHPTEKRTHIVSHEHGMTVTKTLQKGEVRLRAGSHPVSPGVPQALGVAVPGDAGAVAVP